jgi:phenylalanine-4-hydroxylase
MGKGIVYEARHADDDGYIAYTAGEHAVWHDLIARQRSLVAGRACREFLAGLERLQLPEDRIPQCPDLSERLHGLTGWQVVPVPALIELDLFFSLLAERRFPAASFIRDRREFDYLEEPDVFHEIFGHTPMLTDARFAAFSETYGRTGLDATDEERELLARLYWFTVEFGLIATGNGLRAYGGGILSSPGETVYAVESAEPRRVAFDPLEALRTPYRIDIMQPLYFVLQDFGELYELTPRDLRLLVADARRLGDRRPAYPPREAA